MIDVEPGTESAARGRELIAQVRQLEAEDQARYKIFAASIQSPNKKYVIRRDPAAEMIAAAIGAPYSSERLRRTNCPFIVISKTAYYAEDDLREVAESILDNATIRRGRPDKRRRRAA
jgi:hypothetical protein